MKTKKSEKFRTVTVKDAVFSKEDKDTRKGKIGPEVRLDVLCTDRIRRLLWFPVKHIQHGPEDSMYCPQWVADRVNRQLGFMKLRHAKIQLEYGKLEKKL